MTGFGKMLVLAVATLALAGCQARQSNEPIVVAVAKNDRTLVAQYLAEGGDPNLVSRDGDPLLYIASGPRGGSDVLDLLIKGGADLNAKSTEGRTALQNAVSWCDVDIAGVLILAGADVNITGKDGERALDMVCKQPAEKRALTLNLLMSASAIGG